MPFTIVLTKEGSSQLISVVPSTWIDKDSILFWPRIRKTSELELLRRDENSLPSKDWKKLQCKVKLHGITTFAEGLKLKELYSSFEDTEDEERYQKDSKINRKHPAKKSIMEGLPNYNSDFEKAADDTIEKTKSSEDADATNKISIQGNASSKCFNLAGTSSKFVQDTGPIQTDGFKIKTTDENVTTIPEIENEENFVSIGLNALNQIIADNSLLQGENKILKEFVQRFETLNEETDKGFKGIQVQLDKIFDHLKSNKCAWDASSSISNKIDEKIAQSSVEFPINSVEQLNILEDKLIDSEFEKALIKKFSRVCGTSGTQKISKIGLQLTKSLFTDELLNQLTWKGIKGCTKVPFLTYIKIRHLFYKIVHLADSYCSAMDSDSFLQNSAIKHIGQRIKRKSSEVKISIPNKKKFKVVTKTTTGIEEDPSLNNLKSIHNSDIEIQEEIKENLQEGLLGLDAKENKISDDTPKPTKLVTVLSDVKITNKMIDLKHESKMINVSSDDLNASQVFDKN